jgi:hypothetical protein
LYRATGRHDAAVTTLLDQGTHVRQRHQPGAQHRIEIRYRIR